MTAIVGGWDSDAELEVDGQVGNGPSIGAGGRVSGAKSGGPGLYMIEPSGLYWVRMLFLRSVTMTNDKVSRDIMAQLQGKADRQRKQSSKSWIYHLAICHLKPVSRKQPESSMSHTRIAKTKNLSSRCPGLARPMGQQKGDTGRSHRTSYKRQRRVLRRRWREMMTRRQRERRWRNDLGR